MAQELGKYEGAARGGRQKHKAEVDKGRARSGSPSSAFRSVRIERCFENGGCVCGWTWDPGLDSIYQMNMSTDRHWNGVRR